jgi:DNA-binding NtrC family response regulator
VEDDPVTRAIVSKALATSGEIVQSADGDEAVRLVRERAFDLVVSDVRLDSDTSGLDVLRAAKAANPGTQVILISAHGSLDSAVEALRAGAFDFIAKPFEVRDLVLAAERSFAAAEIVPGDAHALTAPLPAALLGRSAAMMSVYKQIALAAEATTPVLVVGESGTGKELVARAIHEYGRGRATQRPFVAVNCGALTETLLESELFGHARGSFTGAVADRRGLFEQANGGSIFLDEIGETSPGLQVRLLRVLQEGEVRPVGSARDLRVDARVLAATNRDLDEEVAEKRFRRDLFYRLGALVIRVPPLRERREDIPLLAARFARNAMARARRDVRLGEDAVAALASHAWPGNVRELENTVERLVLAARGGRITASDVHETLRQRAPAGAPAFADLPTLDELEERYIVHVLDAAGGNRTRAARMLGIDRRTLYRMAARFGIPLAGEPGEEEAVLPGA